MSLSIQKLEKLDCSPPPELARELKKKEKDLPVLPAAAQEAIELVKDPECTILHQEPPPRPAQGDVGAPRLTTLMARVSSKRHNAFVPGGRNDFALDDIGDAGRSGYGVPADLLGPSLSG